MVSEMVLCSIAGGVIFSGIGWTIFTGYVAYKKDQALGNKYRVIYDASRNNYRVEKAYYDSGFMLPTWPKLTWTLESAWKTQEAAVTECKRLQTSTDHEIIIPQGE